MGLTETNLQEAFAGESQANRKYLAFAKQADRDGYPQVARLFRAAAAAETIHAHAHLRAMKAVGNTAENLAAAISGETHEFEQMYPGMIAAAEAEGHKAALAPLLTPTRWRRPTPLCIARPWSIWKKRRSTTTTFARSAVTPTSGRPRNSVRSAGPSGGRLRSASKENYKLRIRNQCCPVRPLHGTFTIRSLTV